MKVLEYNINMTTSIFLPHTTVEVMESQCGNFEILLPPFYRKYFVEVTFLSKSYNPSKLVWRKICVAVIFFVFHTVYQSKRKKINEFIQKVDFTEFLGGDNAFFFSFTERFLPNNVEKREIREIISSNQLFSNLFT